MYAIATSDIACYYCLFTGFVSSVDMHTTVVLYIVAATLQATETIEEEPLYYDNTDTATDTVYDDTTDAIDVDTTDTATANPDESATNDHDAGTTTTAATANEDATNNNNVDNVINNNDDDVREVDAPPDAVQMRYGKPVPGPTVITRTVKSATNNKLRITKTSNKITLPWRYTIAAVAPTRAELKKLHLQKAHILVMFYDKDLRKLVWDEYLVKQVRTCNCT
jgi:hypothetical protein